MPTIHAIEDDVVMRAGETIVKEVTASDDGVAIDLTNYDVRMSIEFDRVGAQSQLDLTEGSGITINASPTTGKFQWKITDVQSALISAAYPYTIKIEDGSSNEYVIVEGRILLLPSATA